MSALKKKLDKTPNRVYNIVKKDGEGFDLSSLPNAYGKDYPPSGPTLERTLWNSYSVIKKTYEENPDLFPVPPVYAGGFFRDLVWSNSWPSDLDLFFNCHGMDPDEAVDNLCLFMGKTEIRYTEVDYTEYKAWSDNVFRVFNFDTQARDRCHTQVILKDMGPPQDDPLYVTKDFNYNHSKMALPIVGDPCIHAHGHAVFGWEEKCHVQFGPRGLDKCKDHLGSRNFQQIDLWVPPPTSKPKRGVKLQAQNPCREVLLEPTNWAVIEREFGVRNEPLQVERPAGEGLVRAAQQAQQMRNQFIDQFDPLRNNRRPLP